MKLKLEMICRRKAVEEEGVGPGVLRGVWAGRGLGGGPNILWLELQPLKGLPTPQHPFLGFLKCIPKT